ncbi:MAG: hypothetical protein EOP15_00065 [Pseudomonas sp.]|nr:MAG: hypothetical protein EOP15_00065 [Pseudomonas sp.]
MSNNQMVLAPRELLERLDLGKNTAVAIAALPELRELLAKPAEQHQLKPVAWTYLIGGERRFFPTDPRPSHGAHAHLITEAQPLFTRPAQVDVVGWQFYQQGKWWNGDDRIKDHRKNTEAAGIPTRDVYTHADPAEVERLRDQVAKQACVFCNDSGNLMAENKKLRAQLAEAHAAAEQLLQARDIARAQVNSREAKLAERGALLREAYNELAKNAVQDIPATLMDKIDSALSASAGPEVQS